MATAEELKAFLAKRGYKADVIKDSNNYHISIRCTDIEAAAKLMFQINEPGRFVIDLSPADAASYIAGLLGIDKLKVDMESLVEDVNLMTKNMNNLENTDDSLRQQSTDSISSVKEMIRTLDDKVTKMQESFDKRIAEMESKPWWKKW